MSVSTEVGRLRTVMLHRPGPELQRLTPRNNDKLLFDGIPWVSRAQEEHDAFAEALRGRGVEVLYLTDLLVETLASEDARAHAIRGVTASLRLGDTLRDHLRAALADLGPEDLTDVLTAGLRNDEVRGGFGLVTSLLATDDFLIDPLPNLLFTRDSSVWINDQVAVTSLAMPARDRETQLTELIYTEHPRFADAPKIHGWHREHLEGGDVLAARHPASSPSASGSVRRPRGSSDWPARSSPTGRCTPCSPYPSPRSGPRCTSTPCARWSTSTRS